MAANAGPPPSQGQQSQAAGEVELTTGDEVKEYRHDEDGENEYLNPMDLHDIKSELEKDAEKAEVRELQCQDLSVFYCLASVLLNCIEIGAIEQYEMIISNQN